MMRAAAKLLLALILALGPAAEAAAQVLSGPTTTAPTQAATNNSTKIANTQFVGTAITNAIAGVNPAVAVKIATTQASDTSGLTYNNGVAGIGATFTGTINTALTIDGVTLTAVGQRILIKNDTQSPSGAFNGVYQLTQLQTGILPPILTRALDYDAPSDINNTGAIPVTSGTANASTTWVITSSVTTVGTDPLTYAQFSISPTNIVTLNGTSQALSGGFTFTSTNLGTLSSGTTTVNCGSGPSQYFTNNGAFTLAAPSNDGQCLLLDTNGASAGTITFSGFTVGTNKGDALTTTNTNKFTISVWRINGTSGYFVTAAQ